MFVYSKFIRLLDMQLYKHARYTLNTCIVGDMITAASDVN